MWGPRHPLRQALGGQTLLVPRYRGQSWLCPQLGAWSRAPST